MPHPTLKIETEEQRKYVILLLRVNVAMEWHNIRVESWVHVPPEYGIQYLTKRGKFEAEYTQMRMRIREDAVQ